MFRSALARLLGPLDRATDFRADAALVREFDWPLSRAAKANMRVIDGGRAVGMGRTVSPTERHGARRLALVPSVHSERGSTK
jgi:hypothetical protein